MAKPPSFSPRKLTELYVQRAFHELSKLFLDVLKFFEEASYVNLDEPTQRAIDAFAIHFVHLFSQADFAPPQEFGYAFIRNNQTISNLVALSPLKTTDAYLELVRYQKYNLVKLDPLFGAQPGALQSGRSFCRQSGAGFHLVHLLWRQLSRRPGGKRDLRSPGRTLRLRSQASSCQRQHCRHLLWLELRRRILRPAGQGSDQPLLPEFASRLPHQESAQPQEDCRHELPLVDGAFVLPHSRRLLHRGRSRTNSNSRSFICRCRGRRQTRVFSRM